MVTILLAFWSSWCCTEGGVVGFIIEHSSREHSEVSFGVPTQPGFAGSDVRHSLCRSRTPSPQVTLQGLQGCHRLHVSIFLRITIHFLTLGGDWLWLEMSKNSKQYLFFPTSNKVQLNSVLLLPGCRKFSSSHVVLSPGRLRASLYTATFPLMAMHGGETINTRTDDLHITSGATTSLYPNLWIRSMGPVEAMTELVSNDFSNTVTYTSWSIDGQSNSTHWDLERKILLLVRIPNASSELNLPSSYRLLVNIMSNETTVSFIAHNCLLVKSPT